MTKIIERIVDLPALPSNWNMLSLEQLKKIHRMMLSSRTLGEYRLSVFLFLSGMKVLRSFEQKNDGKYIYHFRRRGIRYFLSREVLSMESWEVAHWIDGSLSFLDKPFGLTVSPFEFVKLGGIRFKAPESLLVNLTYQQYGNAQYALMGYWDAKKQEDETVKNKKSTAHDIREAKKAVMEAQAKFLSHMFVAPKQKLFESKEGTVGLGIRTAYIYDSSEALRYIPIFRKAPRYLFGITCQLFQSAQSYYKDSFPFLFKDYGGGNDKDALVMEVETINAVQKYAGYIRQQDVYDTNAVFIFSFLNTMGKEAKAIEDMNARIKTGR